MRDGKLCGHIFSQLGDDVTWGYMLPIEPIFEAIAKYWARHHQSVCYPKIADTMELALGPIGTSLPPNEIDKHRTDYIRDLNPDINAYLDPSQNYDPSSQASSSQMNHPTHYPSNSSGFQYLHKSILGTTASSVSQTPFVTHTRVPGSALLPAGQKTTYNTRSSSSNHTLGRSPGTGIASPGQAASQPLVSRTAGDSTSAFVSPSQMNAKLDNTNSQSLGAGTARTSQPTHQPLNPRTASHSTSISSSPMQASIRLDDTNTRRQYRSAIPVPDKAKTGKSALLIRLRLPNTTQTEVEKHRIR